MKKLLFVSVLLVTQAAFAGAPERAAKKNKEDNIKTLTETINADCGCKPETKVDWDGYKTAEDMSYIDGCLQRVQESASVICKADAEGKKAICKNIKTVKISFKAGADDTLIPTHSGTTIQLYSNSASSPTLPMVNAVMEKF